MLGKLSYFLYKHTVTVFLKKWANPGLFSVYFRPFLIAITITISITTI